MENKTKKVEIEIPVGKVAKWVDGVLTIVDENPQDVTERIKTLEDACNELGYEHPLVRQYRVINFVYKREPMTEDLIAYLKMRIITAALNEGWEPEFTKGEKRWYFWYELITKEKYDKLSYEDKCLVVGRSDSHAFAYGGLSYAYAFNAFSYSYTNYGSRLVFKSEKLADYAGKQFAEIYADFCFKPKSEEKKGYNI